MQDPHGDETLVLKARQGDRDAFCSLVERYANAVLGVALTMTRSRHDAEDASQEAFVKAYFGLEQLREPTRFGAWICQIVRRQCIHLARGNRTQTVSFADFPEHLSRPSDTEWLWVRDVLRTLPIEQRTVLVLRYIADWSNARIATFLDLPVGTVESRLSRGRSRLREELSEMEDRIKSQRVVHGFEETVQKRIDHALATIEATYAAIDAGKSSGHEVQLAEAAKQLWNVYSSGAKIPRVVWPLKQLWTNTGHLDRVIELLKDYLDETNDPDERFEAGHYIVDSYAMSSASGKPDANAQAVEHHRRYLKELGPAVSPAKRLGSLSDATITRAWSVTGHLDEWLALTGPLYETLKVVDDDTRRIAAFYLRTLSWYTLDGRIKSIACEEEICRLYKGVETPEAFWIVGNAVARLYDLHSTDAEAAERRAAKEEMWRLAERIDVICQSIDRDDPGLESYRRHAYLLCHDLGCILKWNREFEASIGMLERALKYKEDALTRFFYASVLIANRGDRDAGLESLKKAASDPRTSLIHRFEQAFRDDPDFASVRDDPEFLGVVRNAMKRYAN